MLNKMPSLKENQFYNVALRKPVTQKTKDIGVVNMKNKNVKGGVPALKSVHESSGVTMYKFIPQKSYQRMLKKYGKY